jgi:hypothetical protein
MMLDLSHPEPKRRVCLRRGLRGPPARRYCERAEAKIENTHSLLRSLGDPGRLLLGL